MSNLHRYLPPEILDHIVDSLHGEPETLKACCLVAKSWVQRTQKYLFAAIEFHSAKDLLLWKKTFPDPANSPAHYAHTLSIGSAQAAAVANAEGDGWIRAFSRVETLDVFGNPSQNPRNSDLSLALFLRFSPTLKSLRARSINLPYPHLLTLIRSSPLLENLTLTGGGLSLGNDDDPHEPQTVVPSTSPPFTGSLELFLEGMGYTTRRLLDLPNGIHFRKLALWWICEEDIRWIMELVMGCSDTLECLDIECHPPCTFTLLLHWTSNLPSFVGDAGPVSFDLSKATKLEHAVFRPISPNVKWIALALQTITPRHREFRQISIYIPYAVSRAGQTVGEPFYSQWLDLDSLLVHLWESRSIRTKMMYTMMREKKMSGRMQRLLPEMTKRGVVDLVKHDGSRW